MAIDFDATGDYLGNASAVFTGPPATLACWFNADIINAALALINVSDGAALASADEIGLYARGPNVGDPLGASSRAAGAIAEAVTTTGFSANTWHHGCAVFASTTSRAVYIDGGSKGTNATSNSPTGIDRTSIGATQRDTPSNLMDGEIADAAIWNAELTDAEIAILAKGVSPLTVRPQNIAAYWPLVRSPYNDWVGGFHMTINGNPTVSAHRAGIGWVPWRIGGARKIAPAAAATNPGWTGGGWF